MPGSPICHGLPKTVPRVTTRVFGGIFQPLARDRVTRAVVGGVVMGCLSNNSRELAQLTCQPRPNRQPVARCRNPAHSLSAVWLYLGAPGSARETILSKSSHPFLPVCIAPLIDNFNSLAKPSHAIYRHAVAKCFVARSVGAQIGWPAAIGDAREVVGKSL